MHIYKIYGGLTTLQNASAYAFSSFAVVHGAQIAISALGGPDAGNRWLLLGRPFYQDEHTEGIIVTGAATVHVLCGIAKAGIRWYCKKNQNVDIQTRLPLHHRLAGYILLPAVLLHYDLVRKLPARYFGDSAMLDLGHIAWGLQNWPIFTYTLHGILIGAASWHIVHGAKALLSTKKKGKTAAASSSSSSSTLTTPTTTQTATRVTWITSAGIAVTLLSGLIVIGTQTKKIPLRYDYAQIYKMLFPF
ncbi:hypothetical protein BCR43DRAFT_498573 [Syncephalastrum racemosum]|uniref:Mitochondrial adapter protein MCP1 transmembrane domain-containing protein n=1 Tax=Syncephalastrum racemosum TaxID=13706 RepID=A0A1X2H194_SYNRA|nr:hypothetical protein BCR43DRAFT_498573 [Syncephalastrum racemosum]